MKNSKTKLLIDQIVKIIFMIIGLICASSIVFIVFFIIFKGITPFIKTYSDGSKASLINFLFSVNYSDGNYGVIVLIVALIALPISVLTSLFIVRIAPKKISVFMQTIVELLSSIPSIIFGLFGMGVINPLVRNLASAFNVQTAGGVSTLSVIIVLCMMIMPTITTLSITSMKSVKENQILASYALGASKSQTDFKIVIYEAKSGILASLILGIGRGLGEATAISMVCGGANGISLGLFSPTSTLTYVMMQGFHESSGLSYDIRFSVGIVLIVIILLTNIVLNKVKKELCKNDK